MILKLNQESKVIVQASAWTFSTILVFLDIGTSGHLRHEGILRESCMSLLADFQLNKSTFTYIFIQRNICIQRITS